MARKRIFCLTSTKNSSETGLTSKADHNKSKERTDIHSSLTQKRVQQTVATYPETDLQGLKEEPP